MATKCGKTGRNHQLQLTHLLRLQFMLGFCFKKIALLSFVVDFGQKTLIVAEGGDSCGTKQAGRDPARASDEEAWRLAPRKASARSGNQKYRLTQPYSNINHHDPPPT